MICHADGQFPHKVQEPQVLPRAINDRRGDLTSWAAEHGKKEHINDHSLLFNDFMQFLSIQFVMQMGNTLIRSKNPQSEEVQVLLRAINDR